MESRTMACTDRDGEPEFHPTKTGAHIVRPVLPVGQLAGRIH